MIGYLTDTFQYPFMQRALVEVLLLSIPAGLLGTWIVLRRLSFLTHAVGAATFPGLVLGFGLGFSPWLGAFGVAAGFVGAQTLLERRCKLDAGAITGLLLATALAAGSVLTSDVFHSSATVDGLLFGSLLGIGDADLARALALAFTCIALILIAGRGLLATSFAPSAAASLGYRRGIYDAVLLLVLGAAVVSCAAAIGGFVVSGLLVVPAATVRLVARSLLQMQIGAILLAAVEATCGLVLAFQLDVPPGAAIAVLAASVYLVAVLALPLRGRLEGRGAPADRRGARMRARVLGSLVLALLTAGSTAACAGASSTQRAGALDVVATTTQLQDLVRNVGGSRVSVRGILKPNVDPHEYEPRPSDAVALHDAKLVVESGIGLDGWMGKLIEEAGGNAPVFVASNGLKIRPGDAEEPQGDPHWWHDPTNFEHAAVALAVSLGRVDPAGRAAYRQNAARYVADAAGDGCRQQADAARGAARAAQARDQPRRVRLLRCALRHHGARLGARLALHVGAAEREGHREPRCEDPRGAREGDLHRVLDQPEARGADRERGGRQGVRQPVWRYPRAGRLEGGDLRADGAVERHGDRRRTPGASGGRCLTCSRSRS